MRLTSAVCVTLSLKISFALAFAPLFSAWGVLPLTTSPLPPPICPEFGEIEHGIVKILSSNIYQMAVVECIGDYYLDGNPSFYCINGSWEQFERPQCNKRCSPPPFLPRGSLKIDGEKIENELYKKGTLAIYRCNEGFTLTPKESMYRVCEEGIWTGLYATCEAVKKITNCPKPKPLENGYCVHERDEEFDEFSVGQRVHYSCSLNYVLVGSPVQQCLNDGTWSPKIQPICSLEIADESNDGACGPLPMVPHSRYIVIQGYLSDVLAIPETIVQVHCNASYRNNRAPCHAGNLHCIDGSWEGVIPVCVRAHDCDPPPAVSHAVIYHVNPTTYNTSSQYPIKSQILYQCIPGYTLQGNEVFACSSGGCWLPVKLPTCYQTTNSSYFLEVNSINAVLISIATGAGVLGLLLVICLITVCRRRKPLSRAVPIATPVQRADLGDHATLLHHPDRLALIAFADGMQTDQGVLPTYDEATRDRAIAQTARLQRPHWPALGNRRTRNSANSDTMHIIRHGSLASHTPSTRSGADSMGSTDTVAASEGSTNVTLDTVSSYSGSQAASCRVHCGSLASFDTSSVLNTEGVPLLEESELEEMQGGDNLSLVVDNPSISDNASFKLSTHSAEFS